MRTFWLLFAGLNVFAIAGLLLYNRVFAQDTPHTRRLATTVMIIVYLVILAAGGLFLVLSMFGDGLSPKILIQICIMLLIGGAGTWVSMHGRRNGPEHR